MLKIYMGHFGGEMCSQVGSQFQRSWWCESLEKGILSYWSDNWSINGSTRPLKDRFPRHIFICLE
jgi:hypothetical protein